MCKSKCEGDGKLELHKVSDGCEKSCDTEVFMPAVAALQGSTMFAECWHKKAYHFYRAKKIWVA
jgi:hypothetical protein